MSEVTKDLNEIPLSTLGYGSHTLKAKGIIISENSNVKDWMYYAGICDPPELEITDIIGGKKFTFTPATDCEVVYSIDGETEESSAVEVEEDYLPSTPQQGITAYAYSQRENWKDSDPVEEEYSILKLSTPIITSTEGEGFTISGIPTGSTCYYTLDETDPATSSTRQIYSGLVEPDDDCTVNARCLRAGYISSDMATAEYVAFNDYLTFESTSTITITPSSYWDATTKQYSTDRSPWANWTSGTSISGTYIRFRGIGGTMAGGGGSTIVGWQISGNDVSVSNNIETVLDYQTVISGGHPSTGSSGGYFAMFYNCTALTRANELKLEAVTLSNGCYEYMFYGCSNLVAPPSSLPATNATYSCYRAMFRDCASLTTPPSISATSFSTYSCENMFQNCTSLQYTPNLSATSLSDYCYARMFYGCTSLETTYDLPATTLGSFCYEYMFYGCSSLITAPNISATSLSTCSCESMFENCTSLITAPTELKATDLTDADGCYMMMFKGCTSLETPPILSITTLEEASCAYMFKNCSSLRVRNSSATSTTLFFTCPSSIPDSAVTDMFVGTGGTYTSDPVANGKYYYSDPSVYLYQGIQLCYASIESSSIGIHYTSTGITINGTTYTSSDFIGGKIPDKIAVAFCGSGGDGGTGTMSPLYGGGGGGSGACTAVLLHLTAVPSWTIKNLLGNSVLESSDGNNTIKPGGGFAGSNNSGSGIALGGSGGFNTESSRTVVSGQAEILDWEAGNSGGYGGQSYYGAGGYTPELNWTYDGTSTTVDFSTAGKGGSGSYSGISNTGNVGIAYFYY